MSVPYERKLRVGQRRSRRTTSRRACRSALPPPLILRTARCPDRPCCPIPLAFPAFTSCVTCTLHACVSLLQVVEKTILSRFASIFNTLPTPSLDYWKGIVVAWKELKVSSSGMIVVHSRTLMDKMARSISESLSVLGLLLELVVVAFASAAALALTLRTPLRLSSNGRRWLGSLHALNIISGHHASAHSFPPVNPSSSGPFPFHGCTYNLSISANVVLFSATQRSTPSFSRAKSGPSHPGGSAVGDVESSPQLTSGDMAIPEREFPGYPTGGLEGRQRGQLETHGSSKRMEISEQTQVKPRSK